MFNLLIVDDFEIDRKRIIDMVLSFDTIDINIAGECENGLEALEFIAENKVDLVISDIEMPFMNGLELAKNINTQYPNLKIIFCSLYDEFEYARKALFLNTYGYVLKPLDKEELYNCLVSAINDITTENDFKKEHEDLKKIIEYNKPHLIDNFMKDILYGFVSDEQSIWGKREYLDVKLQNGFFALVYFEIDDYERITKNKTMEQKEILTLKVYEKIKAISTKFGEYPLTRLDNLHYIYTISNENPDYVHKISTEFSQKVIEEFKISDMSLTISISDICSSIMEIKDLFQQCIYTMRYKFTLGSGKVLSVKDIPYGVFSKEIDLNSMQKDIKFLLNSGNRADIATYSHSLFNSDSQAVEESYIRNTCFSIVMCALFVLNENNESLDLIFKKENELLDTISKFPTINHARDWTADLLITINENLLGKSTNKYILIVNKVKDFIEKNYMKSISIESIAEELHYSPNYLSYVFKQTSGETIADYITKLKIEKAKEMLSDVSNKIYNISESLGFNNTAYFCSVFKKFTSMTPKEYRERHNL